MPKKTIRSTMHPDKRLLYEFIRAHLPPLLRRNNGVMKKEDAHRIIHRDFRRKSGWPPCVIRPFAAQISFGVIVMTTPLTAEVRAEPIFSPHFCEFAVDLPSGGNATSRRLKMPAHIIDGESLSVSYGNYEIRAQCLRYENCGLSRLTDSQKLATVEEVIAKLAKFDGLVASVESTILGTIGRAEASTRIDNKDYAFKARIYWGECTRLVVWFATLRDVPEGVGRWLSMLKTVRRP